MRYLSAFALLSVICFGQAASAAVVQIDVPRVWNGSKAGASDGNPIEVKGVPMWRVDRIWPQDFLDYANWQPMVWSGKGWQAPDNSQGGQPFMSLTDRSEIQLAIRSSHAASAGRKSAALVLMAPTTATYGVTGTVHFKRWAGSGQAQLLVLRRDSKPSKRVVEIKRIALPEDGEVKIEPIMIELEAGQELALMPLQTQENDAGTLTFTELKVAAKR